MSNKLNEIQNALKNINDAVFQNLCDAYLFQTEDSYPDVHSIGSQAGKTKTTKGTPDTLITLPTGKYILVEYTTKNKSDSKKAFFDKIKKDLYKCLDYKVTGIKISDIEKVIYCCNSKLDAKEASTLIEHFKSKGVLLEIKDIDTISLNLMNRCIHVAKEYLNIKIDTAQILTPEVFAQEYSKSGIAIPLTNKFFFRDNESLEIKKSILNNVVTILTGAPGVGKSRLALAVIDDLVREKKYKAYCISDKSAPLWDDIRTYFKPTDSYIIFLDDANRQKNHLSSILPLLNENRSGEIKIILTVRDYALNSIEEDTSKYKTNIIPIGKLTDEEITKILESDDIKILNPDYKSRILTIADGNPRLAIMAAKVAKENQTLESLADVSDIYDQYFKDINSTDAFKEKHVLKTIGILSFFYAIDRSNKKFSEDILNLFGIDFIQFNDAIEKLERLELVDTTIDNTVVKISEQVLSTYFFYTTFFKKKELDFAVILNHFFKTHRGRIKDTLIPAHEAFGVGNLNIAVIPYLTDFWDKVKDDTEDAVNFLELFWPYCPNELQSYIFDKIEAQASPKKAEFILDKKTNSVLRFSGDQNLKLLSPYINYPYSIPPFLPALELSFEYVKKNPQVYSEWIKYLSENFVFSYDDYQYRYHRQLTLCDLIVTNANAKDAVYIAAFWDLAPILLKIRSNITSASRNRKAISWYEHSITLTDEIQNIRKSIWEFLNKGFKKNPDKSEDVILGYLMLHDKDKDVYNFDLPYLLMVIKKQFSNESYTHCYIVQDLIERFELMGITHKEFAHLKNKFTNQTYNTHLIVSHNRLKFKDFRLLKHKDYKEFSRLKNAEIQSAFSFKTLTEFKDFYKDFVFLCNWKINISRHYGFALELIIGQNYQQNKKLGIAILKYIINQGNKTSCFPFDTIISYVGESTNEELTEFYALISSKKYVNKIQWMTLIYKNLPESKVSKKYSDEILKLYTTIDHDVNYIHCFSYLHKYQKVDKQIFKKLLTVIVNRNKEKDFKFILEMDFFRTYLHFFPKDINLICKAYIQQFDLNPGFDNDGLDLLALMGINESFFVEFVKHVNDTYIRRGIHNTNPELSIVWQLPNAVLLVPQAIDVLALKPREDFLEDSLVNNIFKRLDEHHTKQAIQLLKKYLNKNHNENAKVSIVFDIIRHSFKEHLPDILKYFLSINKNLETFKAIKWLDNHFSGDGKTIWEDVKVKELEYILSIVNDVTIGSYKLVKHKSYLLESINRYKESAALQRKQHFIYNRW